MFSDGFPYLLCSTASLDKLNQDIGTDVVTYRNFRPNILVDGVSKPYDEVSVMLQIGYMFRSLPKETA